MRRALQVLKEETLGSKGVGWSFEFQDIAQGGNCV